MLFSSVFAITERRDMGLYEVPLSLLGFGIGTMLANFHVGGIMFLLRAVLNIFLQGCTFPQKVLHQDKYLLNDTSPETERTNTL